MSLSSEEKAVMAHFDDSWSVAFHTDPYGSMSAFESLSYQMYESYWAEEVEKFTNRLRGNRVLSLGCGTAKEELAFRNKGIIHVGIDISQNMLKAGRDFEPTPMVARMNMRSLGFASNSFDGIWSFDSFNFVPKKDIGEVFSEVARVLRPGGIVYINALNEQTIKDQAIDGLFCEGWDAAELAEAITTSGMTMVDFQPDQLGSYTTIMATPLGTEIQG